jgi:uncharacterized BrkB/YihY/UPF0761 family membrane protein
LLPEAKSNALAPRVWRALTPTLRYWMETEVHVFAFSISANFLLSFFPFLIVIVSLTDNVLHWHAATDAVYYALKDYFPLTVGKMLEDRLENLHRGFQLLSVLLLLFTANGIFEPFEVALNKAWGCRTNRSFVRNQVVSLGLIFACGVLALLSAMLTGLNNGFWTGTTSLVASFFTAVFFKLAALPISMLILFLIYWLLPNCKVRPVDVIPASIFVGFLLEALKYINLIAWEWIKQKLAREYGPFRLAATMTMWSFFASMLILAGAEWSARKARERARDNPR